MMRKFATRDLRLYLVTDPVLCAHTGIAETVMAAIRGGVTMVQLRDKERDTRALAELAGALKKPLADNGVPLIVNDDVEAAVAGGADGVHIGQDDMTAAMARDRMGAEAILGLTVETVEQARAADARIVDYVGIATVLDTGTKTDHRPAIGFEGLRAIRAATPLPAVAIGGLKAGHCGRVFATGADGIAVVSAICGQPDPELAARVMRDAADDATRERQSA